MQTKLICFDMGGVLFKTKNFWMELHKEYATIVRGQQLTEKYLDTDYARLVMEVVEKLWKGKDAAPYYELIRSAEYMPGIKELFDYIHSQNIPIAIISGSCIGRAERVKKDYGVDYIYANDLVIKDNKVEGEFIWPVGAGGPRKAQLMKDLCRELNLNLNEVIYIGDDSTDFEAFEAAGTSIAFNCKTDALKIVATHIIESGNLKDIIPYIK